ncbi:hypothetical protein KFK09_014864 [Dendrobium nobile]|uniref:PhoD-like phosphatase metallophosphatase domain-containing protein n=1 Tax=Dendrobium nobile TaxID=94219 RepID=A0A8T3B4A5_DENNO|nr:hypothetical protein KFK09_014864 [Dendrobium nobile]
MTAPLVRPRLLPFLFLLVYFCNLCKIIASETREREIRFPKPQSPYLSDAVVSRIAFGSCANQSAPQPIWNAIIDFAPQLFIWLGDNIYGDNRRPLRFFGREATVGPLKNTPRFFPSEESEMRRRYQLAKAQPGYSLLRKRAQVIGTWDDHDYGLNDAGKEFSEKNTSQRLLLDFLDEPEDSARRRQAGVYASYLFGPKGKQVKVVSNLSASTGPIFYVESWGHFPKERKRLYKLISDSERSGVFFISGDVHFAEITRYDCGCEYPLYDITSSGLTQAVERTVPPPLDYLLRLAAWLTPTTMRVYSSTCQYKSCTYAKQNFGVIEIDWDTIPQSIKFEVRSVNGNSVNMVKFSLTELQPKKMNRIHKQEKYRQHCILEIELPWFRRHQLAFAFFGTLAVYFVALIILVWIIASAGKTFVQKLKID